MGKNEDDVIRNFLGTPGKIKATFNHEPNTEKLKRPLPAGAAIWFFCRACGTLYGLEEEAAKQIFSLLQQMSIEIPPAKDLAEYYIYSDCCAFCDSPGEHKPEIRKIP